MRVNSVYQKPNGNIGIIAEQVPVTNLIFEGGGPKGLVYVGAISVLEQKGLLQHIRNVGGSSAGAMTALALGLGFTAREIKNIVYTADIAEFMDVEEEESTGWFSGLEKVRKGLSNLMFSSEDRGRGYFLGNKLQQWACDTIAKRFENVPGNLVASNGKVTFAELERVKSQHPELGLRTICFTGTNYTDQTLEIFSASTTPNMPIDLAVRISMSLPWFFESVKYNGKEYMDGGVLDNYPMGIFDQAPYFRAGNKLITGAQDQNLCTLGLKVDSMEEIRKILWEGGKEDTTGWWDSLKQGISSSVTDMLAGANNSEASKATDQATYGKYSQRTIQIPDMDYSTYNFDLTNDDKDTLAKAGRDATTEWLKNYYEGTGIEVEVESLDELDGYLSEEELEQLRRDNPDLS